MRRVVVHMQSTLNGCIANAQGTVWQHINEVFRAADTIVLSRVMYEAIVPWWEIVAAGQVPDDVPEVSATFQEFASILSGLRKVVISRTWPATDERPVINGDVVAELQHLTAQEGEADILLAAGPQTLGPVISTPGLVDEYVVAVHPAVLASGPQLFGHLTTDLALTLVDATSFDGGVLVLRYQVVAP
jgi:dihydrofolate reductase